MSTITKEQIEMYASAADATQTFGMDKGKLICVEPEHMLELARIALASLEAEPVGWFVKRKYMHSHPAFKGQHNAFPLYTAPPAPAPANADPVAWLWSHRKHPSEVSLIRPDDDERAEGAHWSGWSCQALYAAPPAPVSVPDDVSGPLAHAYKELTPTFMRNHIDVFERYGIYPDGSAGIQAMRIALDSMNRRAAMLQGAEPVTTACKLSPHVFRELVNSLRDTAVKYQGCQQLREQISKTLSQVITHTPHCSNSPVIQDGLCPCCGRKPLKNKTCSVAGCDDKHVARGLCAKHYAIERKKDPSRRKSIRAADKRYRARKAAAPQQEAK
ncbi:TPA: hypothetical protein QCK10_001502 [Enterobacter roggenkampii]|nr:hypothetical protein [Enterobacter roggenkampii]